MTRRRHSDQQQRRLGFTTLDLPFTIATKFPFIHISIVSSSMRA